MTDSVQLGLFNPKSDWTAPESLPDLSQEKKIGFDVETRDPHLNAKGPGFIRGDAYMVGFSIATEDQSWYFPIRHLLGENLNEEVCLKWLRNLLSDESRTIVGANLSYELEACWREDIEIRCQMIDIQIAEPLINEESIRGYSLNVLAKKYLNLEKDEELLREAANSFGGKTKGKKVIGLDPKSEMWKMDPIYVGKYAEVDAQLPLQIWEKQRQIIIEEELGQIFKLEQEVQKILFRMRLKGIPVSTDKAREVSKYLNTQEVSSRTTLENEWGIGSTLDEWSSDSLRDHCDHHGITYPFTAKGNPSFTKDFLNSSDHPFLNGITELRTLNRLRTVFVDQWIFGNQINGWVHCQWKQLASDDGGTRTGRLAASDPNPQQIPGRSEHSSLIRGCFVPEKGKKWAKIDYSQQEPRILVHFAVLCGFKGAQEAADAYAADPDMDFYNFMMEVASVKRKTAKDLYLGRCYGMGASKLAVKLNTSEDEAKEILQKFDEKVPFIKELAEYTENIAQRRGYIRTLLGRRRHFNLWEPANAYQQKTQPLPLSRAKEEYAGKTLRRAHCRKALNSLIQGSAADMTKAAMRAVEQGLGLIAYMQVHDELNYGVDSLEQAQQIQKIMENCVDMKVPIKADLDYGDSWK